MHKHTVAILIGGESRRMGTPKHDIELPSGQTMLDCTVAFALTLSNSMVIVGGKVDGYRCIQDRRESHGPVAGIEVLLESGIDDRYLVIGCDMPRLSLEVIEPLFQQEEAAIYTHDKTVIGLPFVILSSALNPCTEYLNSGKRSIKGFIATIPHIEIPVNDETAALLQSVNTPDDLNKLAVE
jgi:molybdopterin-guanine dinucleotide biosynthesis protein A